MVFGFGYMVLNGVFYVVHINELNVKLIVVVFYLFQIIVIRFASSSSVEFTAQMIDVFFCLAKLITPLVAFGQQRLMFGYGNHNMKF
jgi:hypothetical protein